MDATNVRILNGARAVVGEYSVNKYCENCQHVYKETHPKGVIRFENEKACPNCGVSPQDFRAYLVRGKV